LTNGRENVLHIDVSHLMDRSDDDFVKGLADAVGFKPGFSLLTWINSIMDIITPGKRRKGDSRAHLICHSHDEQQNQLTRFSLHACMSSIILSFWVCDLT
jgi:hypothetical protein